MSDFADVTKIVQLRIRVAELEAKVADIPFTIAMYKEIAERHTALARDSIELRQRIIKLEAKCEAYDEVIGVTIEGLEDAKVCRLIKDYLIKHRQRIKDEYS